ncbi:hypothetical protein AVEN_159711-1, partial [Araneus ventricosus]
LLQNNDASGGTEDNDRQLEEGFLGPCEQNERISYKQAIQKSTSSETCEDETRVEGRRKDDDGVFVIRGCTEQSKTHPNTTRKDRTCIDGSGFRLELFEIDFFVNDTPYSLESSA